MSNVKITELPLASTLDGTEALPIVQTGTTSQTSIQNVSDYVKPYKVYTALLTQTGTNAPTAIVLENTIGEIIWSRVAVGQYIGTLTNAFTANKTYVMILNSSSVGEGYIYSSDNSDVDTIFVQTYNVNTSNNEDSLLNNVSIEIRVYN